ncbi:hypothetical protein LZD49_19885 [Dyadobacter sp. CY261]|uniref:hypothetical protein n=1 Tax=Dyadobacter sp. CY261 TaxID=2907203 RepID=UPI001F44DCBC|nr:hypothetical protein [Dyadobacter sp. CY261]MCF0072751.1 hypothetical protein [Dyadobacter sp. CY261]
MKKHFTISTLLAFTLISITRDANAQLKIGKEPTTIDAGAYLHVRSENDKNFIIEKATGITSTTGGVRINGGNFSVLDGTNSTPSVSVTPSSGINTPGIVGLNNVNFSVTGPTAQTLSITNQANLNISGGSIYVQPIGPNAQGRYFSANSNNSGKVIINDGTAKPNYVLTAENIGGQASWKPLPSSSKTATKVTVSAQQGAGVRYTLKHDDKGNPVPHDDEFLMSQVFYGEATTDIFLADAIIHYNAANTGGRLGFAIIVKVNGQQIGPEYIKNEEIGSGCYGNFLNIKCHIPQDKFSIGTNNPNVLSIYVKGKRNTNPGDVILGIGRSSSDGDNSCGGLANVANNQIILTAYHKIIE